MRYLALVTDYDGTLTTHDRLDAGVMAALDRLRASGRRAILVTGRRVRDLLRVCDCITTFDLVVGENGAVLYDPETGQSSLLASPASMRLVETLRERGVEPLEVGESVIGTRVPHDARVLEAIRELGLELQVIFNRGAVMVLPAGINKATGVRHALRALSLSPHEIVAVGDAENDHSLLQLAECPVAVQNAVDAVRELAAYVTERPAGEGVVELIDRLIATDLEDISPHLTHHHVALGSRLDGSPVTVSPYGHTVLVAGPSGSGKSSLASGFIERLVDKFYQVCIIDPEGDYTGLPHAVTIGDDDSAPSIAEVLAVLRDPGVNVNVDLLGIPLLDRPAYFSQLLPHLQLMRRRTGRPHWLVIDEAHHLMPTSRGPAPVDRPALGETMLITVHPDHMAASVLALVDVVVAVGSHPDRTFQQFTSTVGLPPPPSVSWNTHENVVACWFVGDPSGAFPMRPGHGRAERIRHFRKYALGDLHHGSFFFRGPDARLNLRAQNLTMFCQIADGVDDETWDFHLRRGDYANWIERVVKDDGLAQAVREIAGRRDLSPAESRRLIHDAIDARYTLPC